MSQAFTTIVPRKRHRVQSTAQNSAPVFAPIFPPDAQAPVGRVLKFSAPAERRVLTLRRSTLVTADSVRVRACAKYPEASLVHVRRLNDVGVTTDEHPDHLTSDTSCDCEAANHHPHVPCIHRRALQSLGGIPGFYARIAAQLANPHLIRCHACHSLLDGTYDDLRGGCCLDCETHARALEETR